LIHGNVLAVVFGDKQKEAKILGIFNSVESIIVYRCSPNTKAQTVNFASKSFEGLCLAIGDGGNDINMI